MTPEQKYVKEMLKEMKEQFDFDKEQEKDLIELIKIDYKKMDE